MNEDSTQDHSAPASNDAVPSAPAAEVVDGSTTDAAPETAGIAPAAAAPLVDAVPTAGSGHQLPPAFKSMARMTRILEQMIRAWDVLSTMTPSDYLEFRGALGQSSGFQSFQYRLVEFRLGAKDAKMLLPHRHDAETHARLKAALDAPSLYDVSLMLLKRRGFAIPDSVVNRDFAIRHLREMVRKVDRYGKLPEYQEAKKQLRAWGEEVQ